MESPSRERSSAVGFEVEPFGGRTRRAARGARAASAVRCRRPASARWWPTWPAGRFGGWANRLERFAATYACRAAVKAGMPLDEREMRELLLRLFATDAAAARRARARRPSCSCPGRSWSDGLGDARVPVLVGPTAVGKTAVALALAAHCRSRWSRPIRGRSTGGSTSAPPSRPGGSARRVAAPRRRRRRSGGALQRRPLCPGGGGVGRRRSGTRTAAGGGRGHRTLHPRAGGRALPRAGARSRRGAARCEHWLARLRPPELVRWAARLDPGFAGGGRQRAARAIEMALLTGHPLTHWQRGRAGARAPIDPGTCGSPCRGRCCTSGSGPRRGDAAARADRGSGGGAGRGAPADAPGLDGVGVREAVRVPARPARAGDRRGRDRHQHPAVRQAAGDLVPASARGPVLTLDATRPAEEVAAEIARGVGQRARSASRTSEPVRRSSMKIGITCYPTYGGSGAVATELGLDARPAGPRGAFHHLRDAVPASRATPSGSTSTRWTPHGRYPLFEHYPLHPGAGLQAARGGAPGGARRAARPLRHSPRHHRVARPRDAAARARGSRSSPRSTAPTSPWWARSRASTRSPSSPSSDPTRSPRSRPTSGTRPVRAFGCEQLRFGDPELREPRRVPARRARRPRRARARRTQAGHPRLQLPRGEAGQGRGPGLRPDRRAMPATLLMIGDGPERDDAEQEARELEVDERRAVPRPARHGGELLQASDLFLLPIPDASRSASRRSRRWRAALPVVGQPGRRAPRGGGRRGQRDPRAARLGRGDGPPGGRAAARSRSATRAMREAALARAAAVRRRPHRADVRSRSIARRWDEPDLVAGAFPRAWCRDSPNSFRSRAPATWCWPSSWSATSRRASSSRWWSTSPRCSRSSWPTGSGSWSCSRAGRRRAASRGATAGLLVLASIPAAVAGILLPGLLRAHFHSMPASRLAVPHHRRDSLEHPVRAAPRHRRRG